MSKDGEQIKKFFGSLSEGLIKSFRIQRPTLVYWRAVAVDRGHELRAGDAPRRDEFVAEFERITKIGWESWFPDDKYPRNIVSEPEYGLPQSFKCRLVALDKGFELVEGDSERRGLLERNYRNVSGMNYDGRL